MKRLFQLAVLVAGLALANVASAQVVPQDPPLQHFLVSGSAAGQPAAIATTGFQLTQNISLVYETYPIRVIARNRATAPASPTTPGKCRTFYPRASNRSWSLTPPIIL
jgi:hypothetical protein